MPYEAEQQVLALGIDPVTGLPAPLSTTPGATETTLRKILWGQSGSTAPSAVPDPNGIKLSFPTPVAPTIYAGAALNGAEIVAGQLTAPHNASITTAPHAGSYAIGPMSPIVVTGVEYYTGQIVSEALLLTNVNGGETIDGVVLFDADTIQYAAPAQADALGHFEFGTGDKAPGTQHAIVAALTDASQIANVRSALGTWTPAAAAAPADSGIISAAACKVGRVMVANSHPTIGYFWQCFDNPAVPDDGTAPRLPSIWIPALQTIVFDLGGASFTNGMTWSDSTTVADKHIAATSPVQCSAEIL
jgi:hypothetical protein